MKHDPERYAAAYLGGLLHGARRRMFERHMVDCEDCWREVDLGRRGRSVAESARELAPQDLRERVRATIETVRPRPRRQPWLLGGGMAAVAAALLVAIFLVPPSDPPEIDAVLAAFRSRSGGSASEAQLPDRLAGLKLVDSGRVQAAGLEAVAHTYTDRSGDEVVVYVADEEWPTAARAEHREAGETWVAERQGLVMICVNEPWSALVVGDDLEDVELAAQSLHP